MRIYKNSKVSISEDDVKKSYFKYFNEEMAPVDMEKVKKILQGGPITPDKALPFSQRNRLFEPGYLECETGYCTMPDGTGYVSNLTFMPGVTAEMFDWWFAWHCQDNLRYKIWDPEDHVQAETDQKHKGFDPLLTTREKYWDTTHSVIEDTGLGFEKLFINFKHPSNLGFDYSKVGTEACSTLVCANGVGGVQPPFGSPRTTMCHFMRDVEGGVELRTRFWMGWYVQDSKDIKDLPDGMRMPPIAPMALLLHNIKEFTNLAQLLPRVYAEEKDKF